MQQYICLSIVIVMFLRHGYTDESVACPVGVWGSGCSKRCPDVCRDNCSSQGLCTDCITGYFGIRCSQTCPPNCSGGRCYRFNVSCVDGCKPGWYGKKCDQTCQCQSGVCERNTGKCILAAQRVALPSDETSAHSIPKETCLSEVTRHRCKRCFQGNSPWVCDGCVDGFKGYQCALHCPRDCKSCKQLGTLCTECRKGFYGRTCQKRCPKCKDGCHLRYAKCQGHCVDGYYGPLCSKRCGINCKTRTARLGPCSQDTGTCRLGCNDRYYGDVCQRKCFRNCASAGKFQYCHSVCRREIRESMPEAASYNGTSVQPGTVHVHEETYVSSTVVVAVIITIVVAGFIVVFVTLNWCVLPRKRKTERNVRVIFVVPREELAQDSDIYDGNQGNETASNTSMLGSNQTDDHERTYLMLPPYIHSTNHRLQLERESEHHYESLDSIHEGQRHVNMQGGQERFSTHLARPYMADRGQASYV